MQLTLKIMYTSLVLLQILGQYYKTLKSDEYVKVSNG